MGRSHSKHCLVQFVHDFLFKMLPTAQYSIGCLMIAKFVEVVTGIPMRVVALCSNGRIIPHYVNVNKYGDVIDAKGRLFLGNVISPKLSRWQGRHFIPEGRKYSDYILTPTMKSFNNKTQAIKYLTFLKGTLKTGTFPDSWRPYAELLVNAW